jgi:hypothetical protein
LQPAGLSLLKTHSRGETELLAMHRMQRQVPLPGEQRKQQELQAKLKCRRTSGGGLCADGSAKADFRDALYSMPVYSEDIVSGHLSGYSQRASDRLRVDCMSTSALGGSVAVGKGPGAAGLPAAPPSLRASWQREQYQAKQLQLQREEAAAAQRLLAQQQQLAAPSLAPLGRLAAEQSVLGTRLADAEYKPRHRRDVTTIIERVMAAERRHLGPQAPPENGDAAARQQAQAQAQAQAQSAELVVRVDQWGAAERAACSSPMAGAARLYTPAQLGRSSWEGATGDCFDRSSVNAGERSGDARGGVGLFVRGEWS